MAHESAIQSSRRILAPIRLGGPLIEAFEDRFDTGAAAEYVRLVGRG